MHCILPNLQSLANCIALCCMTASQSVFKLLFDKHLSSLFLDSSLTKFRMFFFAVCVVTTCYLSENTSSSQKDIQEQTRTERDLLADTYTHIQGTHSDTEKHKHAHANNSHTFIASHFIHLLFLFPPFSAFSFSHFSSSLSSKMEKSS